MSRNLPAPTTPKMNRALALALATLCALPALARADLLTKTATQNNIMINYANPGGAAQSYNLGSFSTLLENWDVSSGNYAHMNTVFTVNTGVNAPPSDLFNHIQLHWYQEVYQLPAFDSTTYHTQQVMGAVGSPFNKMPITDPPSGGWDYMYNGPNQSHGVNPSFANFVDTLPYYYTLAAETSATDYQHNQILSQPGNQYIIEDFPADRDGNNGLGAVWYDYLVATVTDSSLVSSGLAPGQMMILGGFEWNDDISDIEIDQTFTGLGTSSLTDVNTSLSNAAFTGWSAINSRTIIAAPEPTTLGLMLTGLLLLKRPRRNPTR